MSVSEELARLAALRDQGVLSSAEFESEKAKVLAGGDIPAALPPEKKKNRLGLGCAVVFAIIVVLVLIGALAGGGNKPAGSNSAAAEQAPARKVTALELAKAYSANEVAAQKKYSDQSLEVTGTVQGVTLDAFNNPTLQFATDNEFLPAQASFDKSFGDKLGAISKGDKVTIVCASISEVISAPMLNDCSM